MNNRQYSILTAGLVLMGLSCLFPLWKPSSQDFTFVFSPPPSSTNPSLNFKPSFLTPCRRDFVGIPQKPKLARPRKD